MNLYAQIFQDLEDGLYAPSPEEGSEIHKSVINALNGMCRLNPQVTDPQELVDISYDLLIQSATFLLRAKRKRGN